ncbi:MAG: serine/threonine protein phosphatase [Lachnospiraceae bacterium]|nr:serine/threonine protein phosphatase [Agathobacter sp.]MDD6445130.1 serine/threonine protein phosphatase [Lachnospiraceae bacterium]MDY4892270.1 serine/threonine protein phosphatase [Agathobacter sp.]
MADIFEQFDSREAFDTYWNETYVPVTYEDVKEAYEDFVKASDKHIFLSDYEESGSISRDDFMDNLSQAAQFAFQDSLTEAFYDKNPDLYETAFALFEEAQLEGTVDANVAAIFHEEYNRLYREFLLRMFDECLS